VLVAVLALAGCTADTVIENSSVTVATSRTFFSLNDKTAYGASPANSQVLQAVNASFNRYDADSELVQDTSFGDYEVLSVDPFVVRYTIDTRASWSDGVPVDAADLLLAWAANSGVLNTPDFDDRPFVDPGTGRYTEDFPPDVVHFDGATSEGLQYVTQLPEIGDDGRSLTFTWDRYYSDWPLVLQVGLPAHVVAEHALGLDPAEGGAAGSEEPSDDERLTAAQAAKDALVAAIRDVAQEGAGGAGGAEDGAGATARLSAIANFWNSGFNLDGMPDDPSLLVSTGPYTITGFRAGEELTLSANPRYRGDHSPVFETILVRFVADPLTQVRELANGTADIVVPPPGDDVLPALAAVDGANLLRSHDGTFEHLDLRFGEGRSGVFADARVREAFLKVVPRDDILDAVVGPIDPDARVRDSQVFLPGARGYEEAIESNGSSEYAGVDVAGAKALLAAAGVENPAVCLLFDPGNPKRVAEFELIRTSASLAGFRVTDCSSPDWLGLLATPGAYDASLFAWSATNLSFSGLQAIYGSGQRNNFNHYSDAAVDDVLARLSVALDDGGRMRLRQELDRLLWEDAYGLPLYQNPVVVAHNASVTGVDPAPLAPGILWNVWEWQPVTAATKTPGAADGAAEPVRGR
jgi:peptide/nickel transport system substrate-binding protein